MTGNQAEVEYVHPCRREIGAGLFEEELAARLHTVSGDRHVGGIFQAITRSERSGILQTLGGSLVAPDYTQVENLVSQGVAEGLCLDREEELPFAVTSRAKDYLTSANVIETRDLPDAQNLLEGEEGKFMLESVCAILSTNNPFALGTFFRGLTTKQKIYLAANSEYIGNQKPPKEIFLAFTRALAADKDPHVRQEIAAHTKFIAAIRAYTPDRREGVESDEAIWLAAAQNPDLYAPRELPKFFISRPNLSPAVKAAFLLNPAFPKDALQQVFELAFNSQTDINPDSIQFLIATQLACVMRDGLDPFAQEMRPNIRKTGSPFIDLILAFRPDLDPETAWYLAKTYLNHGTPTSFIGRDIMGSRVAQA